MDIIREAFIFALLIAGCLGESILAPKIQEAGNPGDVSEVLAKCEAITKQTAKILNQQSEEFASNFTERVQPAVTYLSAWSEKLLAMGAPEEKVKACVSKLAAGFSSVGAERIKYSMQSNARDLLARFHDIIFNIVLFEQTTGSLENSLKKVQDLSAQVVKEANNDGTNDVKTAWLDVKKHYKDVSSCLQPLAPDSFR